MIDLFAGCGGMSLGFEGEGYRSIMAVEFDAHAAATYVANRPHMEGKVFCQDIADVPTAEIPKADLVIGGPPCQGFSNLGSKDVNDPRNKLWKEYLRFVNEADPKVFVLENVDRFRRSSEFDLLLREADGGLLKNYVLEHALLVASDYGVAQRRPRTIVIGTRRDIVDEHPKMGPITPPKPTHARVPDLLGLKEWETVRSRIYDLPWDVQVTDLPTKEVKTIFDKPIPGPFTGLEIHVGRNPVPMSLQRYAHIHPGGGRHHLPDELLSPCWRNKPKGTTDVMGRMRWDAPSPTIRTEFFKPEKGRYLHPQWNPALHPRWNPDEPSNSVNRPITHLEAALLQDFPREYKWYGTKVSIARQIGNAVPVGLARAIAFHVKSELESRGH